MADSKPIEGVATGDETTLDAFFGGRLLLRQPARGHRSGTDAVLLAAAVSRDFAGLAYDIGAGVGAAGLGVALAAESARLTLVERAGDMARLARENVEANALGDRVNVAICDLMGAEIGRILPQPADLVLTNPPFYTVGETRPSPVKGRRSAHVLDANVTLTDWVRASLDRLAPKGALILIHAPAAIPEILAALHRRAGECVLKPVHSRPETAAHRVLLRAKKGSRAPLAIATPLILHGAGGGFTPESERLHRGEAALSW